MCFITWHIPLFSKKKAVKLLSILLQLLRIHHLYGHVHSSYEWNVTENARRLIQRLYVRADVCQMFNTGAMIPYMDYTPRTLDELTVVK